MVNKHPKLSVTIPDPCSAQWEEMSATANGRFCGQCKKVVYDFSEMTDRQLIDFVTSSTTIPCGRFHNSQLNREISIPKHQTHYFPFNKIAAALLSFLSFKSFSAKADIGKSGKTEMFLSPHHTSISDTNNNIITGIIKDNSGSPLANAIVSLGETEVARTDSNGRFHFEILPENLEIGESNASMFHHLYFSYTGMITVVRSYHRQMGSTEFDVVLYAPGTGGHTSGIPIYEGDLQGLGELPYLTFKPKSSLLTNDSKAMLATVGSKMRAIPYAQLKVASYATAKNKALAAQRVKNIKKYLISNEGITAERINTSCEPTNKDSNVIDLLSFTE